MSVSDELFSEWSEINKVQSGEVAVQVIKHVNTALKYCNRQPLAHHIRTTYIREKNTMRGIVQAVQVITIDKPVGLPLQA